MLNALKNDPKKCRDFLDALTRCQEDAPLTRRAPRYLGALCHCGGGSSGAVVRQHRCSPSGGTTQQVDFNAAFDAYRRLACSWWLAWAFPLAACDRGELN